MSDPDEAAIDRLLAALAKAGYTIQAAATLPDFHKLRLVVVNALWGK